MKKGLLLIWLMSAFIFEGCSSDTAIREQIQKESTGQGKVFEEFTDGNPVGGLCVLTIRVTMKTVNKGFYPFESKNSFHGKEEYPLVFNIGGQGIIWMAKGTPDTQQTIINGKRNPEGGEGMKYSLVKTMMLRPGTYKIYIGLTEEKVQKEVSITLTKGRTSVLEFMPLYFPGRHNRNTGSFYRGLRDFDVFLDGKKVGTKPNKG